jgi:hypothetical protein
VVNRIPNHSNQGSPTLNPSTMIAASKSGYAERLENRGGFS